MSLVPTYRLQYKLQPGNSKQKVRLDPFLVILLLFLHTISIRLGTCHLCTVRVLYDICAADRYDAIHQLYPSDSRFMILLDLDFHQFSWHSFLIGCWNV